MDRESLRMLRAQPGYPRFVAAATLARTSDEMFSVGTVLLVLDRTGSPSLAGAAIAATTLPSILTAPLFGALLDVTGRRRALMAFNQVMAAAMLLLLVATIGHAPHWTIPAITFVAGLTYPLSFGGFTSLIPALVPGDLLAPANALETSSLNLALVIGPALAGLLSASVGPSAPLIVEAALALAAVALFATLKGVDGLRGEPGRQVRGVLAAGLRYLGRVRELRGTVAAGFVASSGYGILTIAFPLFAVDHLGGHTSDAGYMWTAFAIGSTLGALTLVRLQRASSPWWIALGGLPVVGTVMLLWPLAGSLAAMLVLVAVAAVADGPVLTSLFSTYQQMVSEDLRGQVVTTAEGVQVSAYSVGAAVAGPLVAAVGSADALLTVALLQFAAAGVGVALIRLPRKATARA
jgi:predicted MFS family arabinose efflux permease